MVSSATSIRRLLKEINRLRSEPPEGIRIKTNDEDIFDLVGIIQGPADTPYEGGFFRVKFTFTEEFPSAPPKCRMLTKIFHPNVSSAGEICVNTLKKDWKPTYGIEHILVTIKCLLIYPNAESALDEDAGRELLENYESYSARAKLITSVHATTPRPPEFESSPSNAPESPTKPNPAPAAQPNATVSPPSPHADRVQGVSENLPTTTIIVPMKPRSKGPVVTTTTPLQATTNSQQPLKKTVIISAKVDLVETPATTPTSVKRPASSAASNTEKRKKALKRL